MTTMKKFLLVAVCLIVPVACVEVDDLSELERDQAGAGTRLDGDGSGRVRPPNWQHESILDRRVETPKVYSYPDLPLAKIKQVRRTMTEKELLTLLGRPQRHDTELQNVDSGGNDYSATVFTWRYLDRRHASQPLMREFVVRLAHVDNARVFPDRPSVMGPDWVVMSWDLE